MAKPLLNPRAIDFYYTINEWHFYGYRPEICKLEQKIYFYGIYQGNTCMLPGDAIACGSFSMVQCCLAGISEYDRQRMPFEYSL